MKPEQEKDLKPARKKWETGGKGEGQGKEWNNGSEGRDGKERRPLAISPEHPEFLK